MFQNGYASGCDNITSEDDNNDKFTITTPQ